MVRGAWRNLEGAILNGRPLICRRPRSTLRLDAIADSRTTLARESESLLLECRRARAVRLGHHPRPIRHYSPRSTEPKNTSAALVNAKCAPHYIKTSENALHRLGAGRGRYDRQMPDRPSTPQGEPGAALHRIGLLPEAPAAARRAHLWIGQMGCHPSRTSRLAGTLRSSSLRSLWTSPSCRRRSPPHVPAGAGECEMNARGAAQRRMTATVPPLYPPPLSDAIGTALRDHRAESPYCVTIRFVGSPAVRAASTA